MSRKLGITLATDERMALRRFAHELGESVEEAAAIALRGWLVGRGDLELAPDVDEETETLGEA